VASQLVPLVGRDAEVEALALALDAAAAGVARVVALVGDPGVGKSRLVEESMALARSRGFLTLHAVASPLHADLHYGVVVEALRPLLRTVEAGARTRLVEGLPDLGRLFDGLGLPAPPPLGDPGMERTRLFEAVCRLFDRLTRQQPVLLAVDDLQWADPASLAMLHYVVQGLVDHQLLVLITRRTGESSSELEVLVSSLRQFGLLTEREIGYLNATGVTALARGLLADEPPSTLVRLLVERTRGLPLFVRALVRMLVDSGRLYRSGGRWVLGQQAVDEVPPEVTALLRSRIDALVSADREVFDTLAVAGGTIGHDLLLALGPSEAELLGCLKRLRDAGLLVEYLGDAGVRYQLTHPLLVEVAYGELPAVVRQRRHAAMASALQRLDPADLGRLAYHVRGAGDQIDAATALDILLDALQQALEHKAGEEAVAHAEAAIGLARRMGRGELFPALLEQRAEALELAGRSDAAIAAWREATEYSTTRGQTVDVARQLRRLALVEWDTGHLADSQIHLDAATAALSGTPVGPEQLALAQTRAVAMARRGRVRELSDEVAALDRLAAATGSRQAVAFAELGRSDLCLRSGDHDGAESAVSIVMRIAREDGSILLLEEAHHPAFCNALAWGDHALARQLADEGRRLARETGVPALELIDRFFVACADFIAGAWDVAEASAEDLFALGHRVGFRRGVAGALCLSALVRTGRGHLSGAMECLREARSVYHEGFASDQHLLGLGDVCEAMVLLGRSDFQSALPIARSIKAGSGIAIRPFCLRVLGEAQVGVGDLAGARETAMLVARDGPEAPYPSAVAGWLRGLVAKAEGDLDAASNEFGRAADGFATLTMPYEAAIARLDWGELVAQTGSAAERAVAASEVSGHLGELERMGAKPVANRARRLLRRLGARPTPAPRIRLAGQLSMRETEIAQLVAEGLSNPEIADRLFISRRTVTTHLQHIYCRLGVTSRTGLTRYVVEHLSR
jgi:DNA-binding CsgD family transcriptional regulator/tetratricopeptide (TPR) repeat protein